MDFKNSSCDRNDGNHYDHQSLNCKEKTDKTKLTENQNKISDEKNKESDVNNCDINEKNSIHIKQNMDLNLAGSTSTIKLGCTVSNAVNKTKYDESSIMVIEPIKKKSKISLDNSAETNKIDENIEPSCSSQIVSDSSISIKNRFYREQLSDPDECGEDDLILCGESQNSINQRISNHNPEIEITKNSLINQEENAQSDRDELDEQQSDSSEKADDSSDWTTTSEDDELIGSVPNVLEKKKPKPQWFILPEVMNRQIGSNKYLDRNFHGSLHVAQRMKLLHKMDAHEGCVNALCFNENGKYLASASDDLKVIVWDWAQNKYKNIYTSGHRLNIFDVKWLPIDFESLIVTCARDGQVRLIDTRTLTNQRLTSHRKEARGLAVHPDHVYGILSAGDDGKILSIDIRAEKPTRLITVKDRNSHISLYTIHINPCNSNEFCVGGRSSSAKIYDRRRCLEPIYQLCPPHLCQTSSAFLTSAVYNYNGTELLVSYNDDDIYLFDTGSPHPSGDFAHHYEGHRNSVTVKGVNFFGPKSEFIVSGSDCANIFIWEKNSEAIVQWMHGDTKGVVNRLESHPHAPILATCGLDSDVKMWIPSNKTEPKMPDLESCIKTNLANRVADGLNSDVFDSRMLSVFIHYVGQYGLYHGQPGMRDRTLQNLYDDISESSNESVSSDDNNGDDSSLDDSTEHQCSPS